MLKRKKMTISKKIFVGALAALLLSSVLLLLGHLVFFHRYYTYLITERLMETVTEFSDAYQNWHTDDEINDGIIDYSNNSDLYVMVMSETGDPLHMVSYDMLIRDEIGGEYRITLDNAIRSKQFQDLALKKGDYVTVGYRQPAESDHTRIYVPDRITANGRVWVVSPVPFSDRELPSFNSSMVSGEVISITLPSQQNIGSIMQRRGAFAAAMDWRFRSRSFNSAEDEHHYFYNDTETGNIYIVGMKRVQKDGKNEVVLAIFPMRSVTEAVAVSKRMSVFWALVAVISAGIIALILTRIVSKPILNMTAVTKKMRNLDFSEKCRVISDDEIGMLAQNINDMSQKLDATILELKMANDQLTQDIEHERKLENQRKEFVAAVSHELKTPLGIIQAYTEGIIDGISGENQVKYLEVILEETKRMDRLVLEMLENARLEAGAFKLEIKRHDLCALVQKVSERFEKTISDSEITLDKKIPETPVFLDFDLYQMDQVITNFITNAIFHTQKGGRIMIETEGSRLSVNNTGRQIKEEELDKIWDKFYKTDKSRTRSGRGTGLGLSIAKNILNLHHAKYGVCNTPDGVTFWFEL